MGEYPADDGRHVVNDDLPWALVPEALLYDHRLSDKAVRVYGCLVRHGDNPDNCYPSQARIAGLIGCEQRSIQRPLKQLVEAGWVIKVPRFDPSGMRTSDGFRVRRQLPLAAQESAESALESVDGPRDGAQGDRAESSDEREPLNDSQENENKEGALSGAVDPVLYEESRRLCDLLADLIEGNGSKRPTVTAAWVAEGERMLRIDKREADKVERCIRWCQADPFWRANILSMTKLRAKYDQLRLAAQRQREARQGAAAPVTASREAPEGRVQL